MLLHVAYVLTKAFVDIIKPSDLCGRSTEHLIKDVASFGEERFQSATQFFRGYQCVRGDKGTIAGYLERIGSIDSENLLFK